MKKLSKIFILLLVTITLVGCGKVAKLENGKDAVATMKDGEISAEDLFDKIKGSYGRDTLITMIDEIILGKKYPETKEEKAKVQDQVDSLNETATSNSMTVTAVLNYYGYKDLDEFKDIVRLAYKREIAVKDYVKGKLTDAEIDEYYKNEIFGDVKAKHILISANILDGMTEAEKKAAEAKAEKTAKEVIAKLKAGESFDALAKEYSDDNSNKNKGGDLGWFNTGDMVAEFETAAFALKKDAYTTSPVKTKFGYHIILKTDEKKKPEKKDLLDTIKDTLVTKKLTDDTTLSSVALEEIRKANNLEIHDSELKKQYDAYMKELKTKN